MCSMFEKYAVAAGTKIVVPRNMKTNLRITYSPFFHLVFHGTDRSEPHRAHITHFRITLSFF